MQSAGESPRGVLKRVLSKLSKIATPAALESLPRLVALLGGSQYLHDIVGSINRKYYKRKAEAPATRGAGREGRRARPGGGAVLALRDPAHHLLDA